MLNFTDLSLRRGRRLLFTGATFSLFRGEKVGITGENGSGKSSLLALVRGELTPEAGSFDMPAQLAMAHVSQELAASDRAAIEFVLDGDAELREIERALAVAEQRRRRRATGRAARPLREHRRLRRGAAAPRS